MNQTRTEQSQTLLEIAADRRGAMRSLGGVGMALLTALGLQGASAKKNATNANEVKHQSRAKNKKKKSKPGALGPSGPVGPAGPPGIAGLEGSVGPAGLPGSSPTSKIRFGNVSSGSGLRISNALCNQGEHAVGGSFSVEADFITIRSLANYPIDLVEGGVPTGWTALIDGFDTDASIQAFVICVPN